MRPDVGVVVVVVVDGSGGVDENNNNDEMGVAKPRKKGAKTTFVTHCCHLEQTQSGIASTPNLSGCYCSCAVSLS